MPSLIANNQLVSCIMIFLNGEKFIEEAISSIFSQTYTNWELLLVDDGSTDRSTSISRSYAERYPNKVFYFEHPNHQNRGMSATRNLGIQYAKGDFIAFLDADDIWMPEKLEQQLTIFKAYPQAAMVYGRTLMWYSWQKEAQEVQKDFFPDLGVPENTLVNSPNLLLLLLKSDKVQSPTTCNAILRRDIFNIVGGFEEIFRGMYEDLAFFSKIYLRFPVFVADKHWANYRQHPGGCFTSGRENVEKFCTAKLFFLAWLKDYLKRGGIKNFLIWALIRKEETLFKNPFIIKYWLLTQKIIIDWGRKNMPNSVRHFLWITIGRNI